MGEDSDFRPCPDFELAPLELFPPDCFRVDDPLDGFVLSLALAFNDLKDVNWLLHQVNKGTPPEQGVSEYYGQWHGMRIYAARTRLAILHETLNAIDRAREGGLLEEPLFKAALRSIRGTAGAVESWNDLVSLAAGENVEGDDVRKYLEKVRHNLASHYYQPKLLLQGFAAAFYKAETRNEYNEHAMVSLGLNLFDSRFYFADAAVQRAGIDILVDDAIVPKLGQYIEQAAIALRSVVMSYLLGKRGDPKWKSDPAGGR